jgi:hypothetical protein
VVVVVAVVDHAVMETQEAVGRNAISFLFFFSHFV